MIEVDPIEIVMKARRKCPGYVGDWTIDALEQKIKERRERARQLQEETEIAETKRKSLRRRLHKEREE